MLRRHVLAALAAGVAAGDDDAARAAIARTEWALRGPARRRLERALLEATLATGAQGADDPEQVRHLLRTAALIVRDRGATPLPDPARVAAAYAATREPAPPRLPVATLLLGVLALVTMTTLAGGAVRAIAGKPREAAFVGPAPSPAVGVFRDGGVPRHDRAIEDVLAGDLPRLAAASAALTGPGAHADATRAERLARLRAHRAFAGHGPGLAAAWRGMLGSLERWVVLTPADAAWASAARDLRARVELVSDQLAAAQLGYHLEPSLLSDHPRRRTGIFTYRIENVAFVRSNDRRIRVLEARRLDPLEDAVRLLGLKAEELDDPIVLLDTIEAKVQEQVLPVLAGRAFPLGDDGWAYSPRGRAAAQAAGDAIRRELRDALYPDVSASGRAAARCRELLVASVRHHEAQHRLDQDLGLPHPEVLSTRLGDGARSTFGLRARYELSAYLSQIASDVWLPRLTLWNLARHGFRRAASRSEEAVVAAFVVEGLARRLGLSASGDRVLRNGEIDRDRLATVAAALSTRTTAELRAAAAGLWAELYGRPLVRLYE